MHWLVYNIVTDISEFSRMKGEQYVQLHSMQDSPLLDNIVKASGMMLIKSSKFPLLKQRRKVRHANVMIG